MKLHDDRFHPWADRAMRLHYLYDSIVSWSAVAREDHHVLQLICRESFRCLRCKDGQVQCRIWLPTLVVILAVLAFTVVRHCTVDKQAYTTCISPQELAGGRQASFPILSWQHPPNLRLPATGEWPEPAAHSTVSSQNKQYGNIVNAGLP